MPKLQQPSKHVIKTLYQLLYDVHRILEKNGVMYWMDGGTALGAVRHKGIIPWDDDVDIAIFKSDSTKIKKLEKQFKKCGYGLLKVYYGFKIFPLKIKPEKGRKYSYPNLDIFTYIPVRGKLRYSDKRSRDEWPGGYYGMEELFPLRKYTFGKFEVWGAQNYKNYFSRMYGKSWNTIAYRNYDHKIDEPVEKVKIRLTEKDRMPAKPTKVLKRKCIG